MEAGNPHLSNGSHESLSISTDKRISGKLGGLLTISQLQGIYPCSMEMIGARVPLTTNIGVFETRFVSDSGSRGREGLTATLI